MKRTTLILDAGLYAELKKRAAAEGRTLTEIVERTLRRGLADHEKGRRARVPLPSYDLGPFLVSPGDAEAVADAQREPGAPEES